MRVLVTGGSGRFATFMVRALQKDHEVVLASRTKPSGDLAAFPWIEADLNDWNDCQKIVADMDAIQHLGAVPSPSDAPGYNDRRRAMGLTEVPFDATMKTNIIGTYYLVKAAVEAGVQTMVMTGSNCAFGHGFRVSDEPFPIKYLPLDEEHPSDVQDSYSYSKLAGEELLAWFTRAYGIRTYVTRPAGICPPERLENMAESCDSCTDWSDWMWGYVASEDLAELQCMLMEQADDLPAHDVFVANGLDSTLIEPSLQVIEKHRPELLSVAHGMNGYSAFFSTTKAQRMVGWAPKHSWRDYLK